MNIAGYQSIRAQYDLSSPVRFTDIVRPLWTQRQSSPRQSTVLKGALLGSENVNMVKESVDGFTALPLQITQVQAASLQCLLIPTISFLVQEQHKCYSCILQGITYQRYLYLKKHEAEGARSSGLFVAGVPFFHQDTRGVLQELFEGFGPVRDVVLHPSKVCMPIVHCLVTSAHHWPAFELCHLKRALFTPGPVCAEKCGSGVSEDSHPTDSARCS